MKKVERSKANETYLQGYIDAKYSDLVKVFGEPNDGPNSPDMDKTTCQWVLEYKKNSYCTIYDWKTPETFYSLYRWHIGGHTNDCVDIITNYFMEKL